MAGLHTSDMKFLVPRRATALNKEGVRDTRDMADWCNEPAYVLLGDPGSGKSAWMDQAARAAGTQSCPVRDLIAGILPSRTDNPPLFIDGLDEARAGRADGSVPLDAIRERLNALGRPRFRLSCREADWLGQADADALRRVAPGESLTVLHLEPLSTDDILAVLAHRDGTRVDGPALLADAERLGVAELLSNPLLLDLMARAATTPGGLPATRQALYATACRQMLHEPSPVHRRARPIRAGSVEATLHAAGMLCAVLLLSQRRSVALSAGDDGVGASLALDALSLDLPEAERALQSNLFNTGAGLHVPRHRSIAEYLAGAALAKTIRDGLSLGRVLALMQGDDGRPVESLRGLFAWLAVHLPEHRAALMRLDPLGLVLNGDAAALSTAERLDLLDALRAEAEANPWLRNSAWVSHPFGALATRDMAPAYATVLAAPPGDRGHQAFMSCVFDALKHGQAMPELAPLLAAWVENPLAMMDLRLDAYAAWRHHCGGQLEIARAWLDRLADGSLPDQVGRLAGALLGDLYPDMVTPCEVLKYLPAPGTMADSSWPWYTFWWDDLLSKSKPEHIVALANAWCQLPPDDDDSALDHELIVLRGKVLAAALEHRGDQVPDRQLFTWLGIPLDMYGSGQLEGDEQRSVALWLEARPQRMKALVAYAWATLVPADDGQLPIWTGGHRLHGAKRPKDWLLWLLDHACVTEWAPVARHCLITAAAALVDPPAEMMLPSMAAVEATAAKLVTRWPDVQDWREMAWSLPIDHYKGAEHRRRLQRQAELSAAQEVRREALAADLSALMSGHATDDLLHKMTLACEGRFNVLQGSDEISRLQSLFVCDPTTATVAMGVLEATLTRPGLPSADDILALDSTGNIHPTHRAALFAARRIEARDPLPVQSWSAQHAQRMAAFWLTDGLGNLPTWYRRLVAQRASDVAPVFIRYAAGRLRRRQPQAITGLWALAREDDHAELARTVLPVLLEGFPLRAGEASRRELNHSLLSALPRLDDAIATEIVQRKLAKPTLDPLQRVGWLVAALPYDPSALTALAEFVGRNERRIGALGAALEDQRSLSRVTARLSAEALARLIEVLAIITAPADMAWQGLVTPANHRGDALRALFNALATNPDPAAALALQNLLQGRLPEAWRDLARYSLSAQRTVARDASFQPAEPEAVARTLSNSEPANTADLAALTLAHLRDLEDSLRHTDTYLLRQFWAGAKDAARPLNENLCRDLLVHWLRERLLRLRVHVETERRFAKDKRCDIAVTITRPGHELLLPIEAKKDSETNLWTACRAQLDALYVIDPAAQGRGIFLVLWFGERPVVRDSVQERPTAIAGRRPGSAQQLQDWLTECIPAQDRSRLIVHVMDLSRPDLVAQPRPGHTARRHKSAA